MEALWTWRVFFERSLATSSVIWVWKPISIEKNKPLSFCASMLWPWTAHRFFTEFSPNWFYQPMQKLNWYNCIAPKLFLENTEAVRTRRVIFRTFIRYRWRHLHLKANQHQEKKTISVLCLHVVAMVGSMFFYRVFTQSQVRQRRKWLGSRVCLGSFTRRPPSSDWPSASSSGRSSFLSTKVSPFPN